MLAQARPPMISSSVSQMKGVACGDQCHFIDMLMVQIYGNIWGIYLYENRNYAISYQAISLVIINFASHRPQLDIMRLV